MDFEFKIQKKIYDKALSSGDLISEKIELENSSLVYVKNVILHFLLILVAGNRVIRSMVNRFVDERRSDD